MTNRRQPKLHRHKGLLSWPKRSKQADPLRHVGMPMKDPQIKQN
jgi:hypothetical protein